MLAIQSNSLGAVRRPMAAMPQRASRMAPMTPRQAYDVCCEPWKPCCDELVTGGLGAMPRGARAMTCCCNNVCTYTDETCCGSATRSAAARRMFGLAQDGSLMQAQATITQTVAERVAAIRQKMVAVGIPVAVGSGVVTMLTFAGAFGLARTERVWMPAIWLGALTTIGGLIAVATAAKTSADAAKQQEAATPPTSVVTPAPTPTPPQSAPLGSYYGYGY